MAKQLYHKELRALSPISVTVKEERQKSTYSKGNETKPDYITLVVNGEDRYYTSENESCAAFFTGKRGKTFTIVAEGSRDDATITCVGQSAASLPQPEQRPQRHDSNPPGRPGGAQEQPPAATPAPKQVCEKFIGRRMAGQLITLRATMAIAKEFEEFYNCPMPPEMISSINATLFIAADRAQMFENLPIEAKFSGPKAKSAQ